MRNRMAMPRTSFLREAADWIDDHPYEYEYFGWHDCVAGTIAKLNGANFESNRSNMVLVPGQNSVHLSQWVQDLVGLDFDQSRDVFLVMDSIDRGDPHAVAEFVRRYADELDDELDDDS